MCGIVGYVGKKSVVPVILDGLRRLEYRGYDSAGIAVRQWRGIATAARRRQTAQSRRSPASEAARRHLRHRPHALGHARPADRRKRASSSRLHGPIVVVHNGIVENYLELKKKLLEEGHQFVTETDTEVIAHLIEEHSLEARRTVTRRRRAQHQSSELRGIFALSIISTDDPNTIISARQRSAGRDRHRRRRVLRGFRCSGDPGSHARYFLSRRRRNCGHDPRRSANSQISRESRSSRQVQRITWDPIQAEKGGFKHFMLKEIYEQPRAVRETVEGRISLDTGRVFLDEMKNLTESDLKTLHSIKIAACGTSWHAGHRRQST